MAREKTPQEIEAERNVAPNVVGRRRPYRIRGTPRVQLGQEVLPGAQDFLETQTDRAKGQREKDEILFRARLGNQIDTITNDALNRSLVAEGQTAGKVWLKEQESVIAQVDEIRAKAPQETRDIANDIIATKMVRFEGTGSRHVSNELHNEAKTELKKAIANGINSGIGKAGEYIKGKKSGKNRFFELVKGIAEGNDGELSPYMNEFAEYSGMYGQTKKEFFKSTASDLAEKGIDFALGNGDYEDAKAIFEDMKKIINNDRHDEIQAKLARGEELEMEDKSLYIFNQANSISNGDPVKRTQLINKMVGNDSKLNKGVQAHERIFEARQKVIRDHRKGQIQEQMFDLVFNNHRNNVPLTTTMRQLDAGMDRGNAPDNRTFNHGDRAAQINFAKKVYENKLVQTDPQKYSDLMYESINAPNKFAGRNLSDPNIVKGLDYNTIQYLKRKQDSIMAKQQKPPPDFMWEGIKDRMDEISEFLPEEQRFDFLTENYENIQNLMKDGKFDGNAMKGMMRKFDQFDAAQKPWWWNRAADAFVPGYETQAMQDYRSQLKDKDFSYYPNIELLKKFEGDATAAKIMMNMQKRHLQRQRDSGVKRPVPITTKQLNENLSTYINKKGYRNR